MYKKFKLYKEFGSLNSTPVFSAFEQGVKNLGLTTTDDDDSIPVIWSVLWQGRMSKNKEIYELYQRRNLPVVIIEIGNFFRGITWRVSINNVNRQGIFSNNIDLDFDRPKKLGVSLTEFQETRSPEILITGQHERSLQWKGQPSTNDWVGELISNIKLHTDRQIVFRPHPRSLVNIVHRDVTIVNPIKIHGTYDDYDFNSRYHCVINHNSGPGIQAAIHGVPVIVDSSSLAYPVSNDIKDIEHPYQLDRTDWIVKLTHTEWTIEEIALGIPLKRLLPEIELQLS